MRKIRILFKKDFIDFFKNMAVFVSCIIPIAFAVIYKYILADFGIGALYLINMILGLNLAMISVMIPATTIAEEKEKFTMRTLMLSNVSGVEIFTAKILVTSVIMLISNTVIFFISGVDAKLLPMFIVITVIGGIPLILLGGSVGILARDQMNAGVYEVPVMMLFLLPSVFNGLNKTVDAVAAFTPCQPTLDLVYALQKGTLLSSDSLIRAATVLGWIVIASIILMVLYRKRGTDN
ncbi:ABC transporter permease [Anaerovorax odorimutans]|uniref:ABC transporter permease n=2 Tax=Anaerovorax odorimutans TaxID=109327 RepID=A0ABT1RNF0_9FIRM|nr:ABC transporter permease [Anaerovorax odorimutans]